MVAIGVVGATGQVGPGDAQVAGTSAIFPATSVRFFRIGPVRRVRKLPFRGQEIESRGRPRLPTPTGLDIAVFSAGATIVAGPGTAGSPRPGVTVIDNSSAWRKDDPGGRSSSPKSTFADARKPAQGHHRQPQLHDDGRDAGAQGAARRGPIGSADRGRAIKLFRAPELAGVAELADQGSRPSSTTPNNWCTTAARLQFPEPKAYVAPIAFQRGSAGRQNWSTTTPAKTDEDQKTAQRKSQNPGYPGLCWSAAPACGSRCSPGTRCRSMPSFAQPLSPERAREILAVAPGVKLVDVPDAVGRPPGVSNESLVGRIRRDPGCARRTRGWRCSSRATICARALP